MPAQMLESRHIEQIQRMLDQKGQGWVRLWTLYLIGECGSLYSAAPLLGLSGVRAVRKRITTLEEKLDLLLLQSESNSCNLTPVGWAVFHLVRSEFATKAPA